MAALRSALTSDNPDKRAEAYTDVLNQDVQPTELLQTPPESAAVKTLRDAGVLGEAPGSGTPASERQDRIIELLEEIAANTGGGS